MGQVRYSDDAIADLLALREDVALNNASAAFHTPASVEVDSAHAVLEQRAFG